MTEPSALQPFSFPGQPPRKMAVVEARSALLPVPELLQTAHGIGNVLFLPDDDAIFRRVPLLFRYNNLILPSLPLAVARDIAGSALKDIPLDHEGRMVLHFPGPPGTYRNYSIASLINSWAQIESKEKPQVDPAEFRGKVVLIGASAPGILDLRPTPVGPVTPGAEVHATAIDNLLRGQAVHFPPRIISGLFILLFALARAVAVSLLSQIRWMILFCSLCLVLPLAIVGLTFLAGRKIGPKLWPFFPPSPRIIWPGCRWSGAGNSWPHPLHLTGMEFVSLNKNRDGP